MRKPMLVLAAVLALLGAPGCGSRTDPAIGEDINAPPRPPIDPIDRRAVDVTGVLTDAGVECPALRDDNRTLYTLSGDIQDFQIGNRVRVVGRLAEVSLCQQGTTLEVITIVGAPE